MVILAVALAFASVFLLTTGLLTRQTDPVETRLEAIRAGVRPQAAALNLPFFERAILPLFAAVAGFILKLLPLTWVKATGKRLVWAHNPMSLPTFVLIWAAFAAGVPVLAVLLAGSVGADTFLTVVIVAVGVFLGGVTPQLWLGMKVADRSYRARKQLPDALDLMTSVLASRPVRHISLGALGAERTRESILEAFDEGASVVSYMGHGGIHLWASENVFNNDSVALLAPQAPQPIVNALDCLNGYFHFPFFDSLAEELLKADAKGAVAVFAPSGLSLNEPAHELHKALLRELFEGEHARLGDAVLAAQAKFLETGSFSELLAIYHLFGDPALELR